MADASSIILAESDAEAIVGAFGSSSTTKGAAGESASAGTPDINAKSVVAESDRELQAYREAQMEAVKANLFLGGERPRSAVFADDDTDVREAKVDADATPGITSNPLSTDSPHVAAAATATAAETSSTPDRAAGVITVEDRELAAGPQLELTIRRKTTEIEFGIEENSEDTIEFNVNIASTDAGSAVTSGGGQAVFSTEAVDATAPQKRRRSSVTGRVIEPQKTENRTRTASRGVRQSIKAAMADEAAMSFLSADAAAGKTLDRTCVWSGATSTEKEATTADAKLVKRGALSLVLRTEPKRWP